MADAYLCDFCGREYEIEEAQVCATCNEEMCEACLETHPCEKEDTNAQQE